VSYVPTCDYSNEVLSLFVNDQFQRSTRIRSPKKLIATVVSLVPPNIEPIPDDLDGFINTDTVPGEFIFVELEVVRLRIELLPENQNFILPERSPNIPWVRSRTFVGWSKVLDRATSCSQRHAATLERLTALPPARSRRIVGCWQG